MKCYQPRLAWHHEASSRAGGHTGRGGSLCCIAPLGSPARADGQGHAAPACNPCGARSSPLAQAARQAPGTIKIMPWWPGMAPAAAQHHPDETPAQPFGHKNHLEQTKLWTHLLLSLNSWLSEVESWCHLPFTTWLSAQTKDGVLSAWTLPPPPLLSSLAATCLALPVGMSHREASLSRLFNQLENCLTGYGQERDVKDAGCPGGHPIAPAQGLRLRVSTKLHANREGQKPFWNS